MPPESGGGQEDVNDGRQGLLRGIHHQIKVRDRPSNTLAVYEFSRRADQEASQEAFLLLIVNVTGLWGPQTGRCLPDIVPPSLGAEHDDCRFRPKRNLVMSPGNYQYLYRLHVTDAVVH
ncbi:unnamed protein product [Lota lota]